MKTTIAISFVLFALSSVSFANCDGGSDQKGICLDELANNTFTCTGAALNAASKAASKYKADSNDQISGLFNFVSFQTENSSKFHIGFKSTDSSDRALNFLVIIENGGCTQGNNIEDNIKVTLE